MHYNENANRSQVVMQEGIEWWSIVYLKAQKGEKAVAKPLKEKPTYSKNNFIFIYELINVIINNSHVRNFITPLQNSVNIA